MAAIKRDRIWDTTTTTGLGAITLSGSAPSGFRAFSTVMSNADTCTITIVDRTTYAWETCAATYNAGILTRGTWYDGSTGAHLDLTAGTKDVFLSVASATILTTDTNALDWSAAVDVASGTSPTPIGEAASNLVNITGTTTITAFDTMSTLKVRWAKFAGALTLTHHATSLILPGGENITTAAGDHALFVNEGSANWICYWYVPKSGQPLTTGLKTIASATTTELGSTPYTSITVSGTTTITSFGSTAPTGAVKDLTFSGALSITYNATSMILPDAASITTAAGDCMSFRHEGSGNWRLLTITRAALHAYDGAGKHCVPVPAGAMVARTTNGAASATLEMTTNDNMFVTFDFDASTEEGVQFSIAMPDSWNEGTITFRPVWSHSSTTTNFGVVFSLAAVAISDDDAGDVAFGTAQISNDTGGTTNDIYIGPESSAITVAGTPAAGDFVMFELRRVVANGSDTMAVDARLHAIKLFITTDRGIDP
jgi:hypothetical protein